MLRLTGLLNYLKSYHDGDCTIALLLNLPDSSLPTLLTGENSDPYPEKMEQERDIIFKDRKIVYNITQHDSGHKKVVIQSYI
jgi:hypothetical protein